MAHPSAANKALIFIPDISGYTKFVSSTEIQHSKHIMEELLEVIIDANEIGLELSEIEGDALLFYRKGEAPQCQEMIGQVQKMYIAFHAHLKKYESQRICSCGACCSANQLNLKFVAHYGELAEKMVKDRAVLFGKDVIIAHRLLKNNVDSNQYGLFSEGLMSSSPTWDSLADLTWCQVTDLEEEYDFGKASYSFINLERLKEQVPEPSLEDFSLPGATKLLFASQGTVDAPIEMVFHVVSDYQFRSQFIVDQQDNDLLKHEIFQEGTVHRCVLGHGEKDPIFVTHDYSFEDDKITFVETDHHNEISVVWQLESLSSGQTLVSISNFIKPNFFKTVMFNLLMKKKLKKGMATSWKQLNEYCQKLIKENRQHPNSIVLPNEINPSVN